MSRIFFAYHLTHVFGPFTQEGYHTNSDKVREGDTVYVVSGDNSVDGGKDYSLEGIYRIHRRTEGPFSLRSISGKSRSYTYRLSLRPLRIPDEAIGLVGICWYSRSEFHRFFSSGQNFNPLPIRPNFKERFDNLLSGYGQRNALQIIEDLAELDQAPINSTERECLINARLGQGKFRSDLTEAWGNMESCALTGINIPELLIASHIKPWRESNSKERLDPANGILLVTHADKLFDRHLLSFQSTINGFLSVVNPRILTKMVMIGLKTGMRLKSDSLNGPNTRQFEVYLKSHYSQYLARIDAESSKGSVK